MRVTFFYIVGGFIAATVASRGRHNRGFFRNRFFNHAVTQTNASTSAGSSSSISPDGSCGPKMPGNYTCVGSAFGTCCSINGWCGSTSDFCSLGQCVSGNCTKPVLGSVSPDGSCGSKSAGNYTCTGSAYGSCCSINGWCGSGSDFCSPSQCVSGNCTKPVLGSVSPDGSCGSKSAGNYTCTGSAYGSCCSINGWCGSGSDFCSPGQCVSGNCTKPVLDSVSPDGSCGSKSAGNYTCTGSAYGSCCSINGWCGSGSDFCSPSQCVSGNCTKPVLDSVSPDGSCGSKSAGNYTCTGSAYGSCCSINGWCGSTSDYCGAGNCISGNCTTGGTSTGGTSGQAYIDPISTAQPTSFPNIFGKCGDNYCDNRVETCFSCPQDCKSCDSLPNPYIDSCDTNGVIHMSWDDGPSKYTPDLLKILAAANIKVTFFLIGERLDRGDQNYINAAKAAFAAGHLIGSHTYTHPFMTTLTDDQIRTEMIKTDQAIYKTLGVYPRYVRLPFGDTNERVLRTIQSLGFLDIFTSIDTQDTAIFQSNPLGIEDTYIQQALAGNPLTQSFISDQHDTLQTSVNQTAYIINQVQTKTKFKFVPMSQCVKAGFTGTHNNNGYRKLVCGDGYCDGYIENCSSCPKDCGVCPTGTSYTPAAASYAPKPTNIDPSSGAGSGGGP